MDCAAAHTAATARHSTSRNRNIATAYYRPGGQQVGVARDDPCAGQIAQDRAAERRREPRRARRHAHVQVVPAYAKSPRPRSPVPGLRLDPHVLDRGGKPAAKSSRRIGPARGQEHHVVRHHRHQLGMSPAAVARAHLSMRSRMACSSGCMVLDCRRVPVQRLWQSDEGGTVESGAPRRDAAVARGARARHRRRVHGPARDAQPGARHRRHPEERRRRLRAARKARRQDAAARSRRRAAGGLRRDPRRPARPAPSSSTPTTTASRSTPRSGRRRRGSRPCATAPLEQGRPRHPAARPASSTRVAALRALRQRRQGADRRDRGRARRAQGRGASRCAPTSSSSSKARRKAARRTSAQILAAQQRPAARRRLADLRRPGAPEPPAADRLRRARRHDRSTSRSTARITNCTAATTATGRRTPPWRWRACWRP